MQRHQAPSIVAATLGAARRDAEMAQLQGTNGNGVLSPLPIGNASQRPARGAGPKHTAVMSAAAAAEALANLTYLGPAFKSPSVYTGGFKIPSEGIYIHQGICIHRPSVNRPSRYA